MADRGPDGRLWEAFARVLEYPRENPAAAASECAVRLGPAAPEASPAMARFAGWAQAAPPGELEEAYTRSFDLEPSRSPYVGFHLFGESYKRSLFLLRLKAEARAHGVDTGAELADHLAVLLRLLAASADPEFRADLAVEALRPAVGRMLGAEAPQGGPGGGTAAYRAVLDALAAALERAWPGPLREFSAPAPEPSCLPPLREPGAPPLEAARRPAP